MLVKIKSWDKMAKKYGVDKYGDIKNQKGNYYFTERMRNLCGSEIELENTDDNKCIGRYDGYFIEEWMVKKNGK